jgi:flavin reductase (DIM6/NTAB) family NADH-FMN oxidoreductase RutF
MQVVEGGDHLMFIVEVLNVTYRNDVPLIFSASRYCAPQALPVGSSTERALAVSCANSSNG